MFWNKFFNKKVKEEKKENKCPEHTTPFDPCICGNPSNKIWSRIQPCCGVGDLVIRVCYDCRKEWDRRRLKFLKKEEALELEKVGLIKLADWESEQKTDEGFIRFNALFGNPNYIKKINR